MKKPTRKRRLFLWARSASIAGWHRGSGDRTALRAPGPPDPQAQQQLRAPIFEDKVVDYIFEQANVTDRDITKEELEQAVEKLDEI